jgi:membrane-associated protease RseP (regulator of RpoE activity)
MEKKNRQWLIAVVAALMGLFLGILCGVVGGGTVGYLLGRGSIQGLAAPQGPQQVRTPVPAQPQPHIPLQPTVIPLPDVPSNVSLGALIIEVLPNTPAERAGLQPGDVIMAVDGQQIGAGQSLSDLIQAYNPGDRVVLTVRRAGSERLRVDVQLVESPTNPGSGYLGVRVQDLAP